MPFGKYRGVPLSEIEDSYLDWVARNADHASPYLKAQIQAELDRRAAARRPRQEDDPATVARERIKSWFASLARDYHPDKTGDSGKVMAALNDAHARLKKTFGL
jgi:hypothetical protein